MPVPGKNGERKQHAALVENFQDTCKQQAYGRSTVVARLAVDADQLARLGKRLLDDGRHPAATDDLLHHRPLEAGQVEQARVVSRIPVKAHKQAQFAEQRDFLSQVDEIHGNCFAGRNLKVILRLLELLPAHSDLGKLFLQGNARAQIQTTGAVFSPIRKLPGLSKTHQSCSQLTTNPGHVVTGTSNIARGTELFNGRQVYTCIIKLRSLMNTRPLVQW